MPPGRTRRLWVERGCKKHFCLVLVKPSHYDDDGYVIQWLRSPIPSTSLAALYGLAQDCAERRVLGPDVEIDVHAFDETNTCIRCDSLAAMIHAAGSGMVMLVGVQSNQFPRALDLADRCVRREFSWRSAGFTFLACLACSVAPIPISIKRRSSAYRCLRARPRAVSMRCSAMPQPGTSSRSTISWPICRRSRARPSR